jgi:hypothetical protein
VGDGLSVAGGVVLLDPSGTAWPEITEPDTRAPAPIDEPTEVVILKSACGLNGERFAPGPHIVPASKAAVLRAIDVGR